LYLLAEPIRLSDVMPPPISSPLRLFACERGSTLVGCSSLVLLVAIAAITLLYSDLGAGADGHRHATGVLSAD
jgi:hypothetical protein